MRCSWIEPDVVHTKWGYRGFSCGISSEADEVEVPRATQPVLLESPHPLLRVTELTDQSILLPIYGIDLKA